MPAEANLFYCVTHKSAGKTIVCTRRVPYLFREDIIIEKMPGIPQDFLYSQIFYQELLSISFSLFFRDF